MHSKICYAAENNKGINTHLETFKMQMTWMTSCEITTVWKDIVTGLHNKPKMPMIATFNNVVMA